MSRGSSWKLSLGLATVLLAGVNGCDDNNNNNHTDLSVGDLSMMAKSDGGDASAATPSTGQITVADLVGTAFTSDGSPETNIHVLKVVASFPLKENTSPNQSGTSLNGCSWDRYDVTSTTNPPPPNENAGTVDITGFDTVYDIPFLGSNPAPPMPSTVHCALDASNSLAQYACTLGTGANAMSLDDYAFPTIPYALAGGAPVAPSPSPSPDPGFYNSDLFLRSNSVTEVFTPATGSSFSTANDKTINLTGVTATTRITPPTVVATTVDGAAGTASLASLEGKLDGTHDITISYSCDGTATPGSGCKVTEITGLLMQTSLGHKWEAFSGANELRFGVLQCVDATLLSTMAFKFTLTKAMIATLVGSDTNQTLSIALVRLNADQVASGAHSLFMTAGRGQFALVDQ